MAYTPPHVFSTGTGLAADELTANNAAAYDYLNAGIAAADLTAAISSAGRSDHALAALSSRRFLPGVRGRPRAR